MGLLRWLAGRLGGASRERRPELVTVRARRLARCYRGVLGLFVDAAEKQGEGFILGRQYVVSLVERLFRLAFEMAFHANALSREAADDVYARLDALKARAREVLEPHQAHAGTPLVIAVADVDDAVRSEVGERLWSYCELGNRLGVPISSGFVITSAAWRLAVQAAETATASRDVDDGSRDRSPSRESVLAYLREAPPPRTLVEALAAHLGKSGSAGTAWLVHLSAGWSEEGSADVGLCVAASTAESLARTYLEGATCSLAATQESTPAPSRRSGDVLAAALCMPELRAELTGSLFTVDPASPYSGRMRLEVEHGEREQVVWLTRQPPFAIVPTSTASGQELVVDFPAALQVARLAGRVERYCGGPREIDWVLARDGRPVVTWVQPLPPLDAPAVIPEELAAARRRQHLLLTGAGEPVCPGVAYGRVYMAHDEADLGQCPDHAVLVTTHLEPSAALLRALRRASAVISVGRRSIDPSAALVRSFRVPAILGAPAPLDMLANGQMVTVDAWDQVVYAGFFAELFHHHLLQSPAAPEAPEYRLLNQMVRELGSPLAMAEGAGAQSIPVSLFATLQERFDATLRGLLDAGAFDLRSGTGQRWELGQEVLVVETPPGGDAVGAGEATRHGISPGETVLAALAGGRAGVPGRFAKVRGLVVLSPEGVFALLAADGRTIAVDARVSMRRAAGHLMLWCEGGPRDGATMSTVCRRAERLGLTALRFMRSVMSWREPLPAGANRERLAGIGELIAFALIGHETSGSQDEEVGDGKQS